MKFRVSGWVWLGLLAAGGVLEGIALTNGIPNDTLSAYIVWGIPAWLGAMGIGWIGWHFGIGWVQKVLGRLRMR